MSDHYAGMGFFEALDECELYNGNPEPFRRCRELYREKCDRIAKLEAALKAAKDALDAVVDWDGGANHPAVDRDGYWRDEEATESALARYLAAYRALD